jgi:hypothetical protein
MNEIKESNHHIEKVLSICADLASNYINTIIFGHLYQIDMIEITNYNK